MKIKLEITTTIEVPEDTSITPDPNIEVSIDCPQCQKLCRTIVFKKKPQASFCTTTFETKHLFKGFIKNVLPYKLSPVPHRSK